MNMFLLIIFWFSLFLIFSTYLFYPVFLYIVSVFIKNEINYKDDYYPSISIIISAFNEEKDIEKKIKNILTIKYPKKKYEVIIGSDGSTDKTVTIAKKFESGNLRILDFKENRGKTAVQNDCVNASSGEIIVFTDAASFFEKDTIKLLIRKFYDKSVGCVAGKLLFVDTDRNINTQSQGFYWKYELMIRKLESKIGGLIGVDGPLYAIRRENYVHLEAHIISDFISPLLVLNQGKKVILEEKAVILEEPTLQSEEELNTRRRITLRAFQGLKTHRQLLNPFNDFVLTAQIFFHKIIRWLVGFLAIVNFFSAIFLSINYSGTYKIFMVLYIFLFLSALIGYILNKYDRKIKIFSIPYYFVLVNTAATMGFADFIRNKQAISWKPVRN